MPKLDQPQSALARCVCVCHWGLPKVGGSWATSTQELWGQPLPGLTLQCDEHWLGIESAPSNPTEMQHTGTTLAAALIFP